MFSFLRVESSGAFLKTVLMPGNATLGSLHRGSAKVYSLLFLSKKVRIN